MPSSDEQHDPESAMERFEGFRRKIFRVTKDDLKKAEEAVAASATSSFIGITSA